MTQLSYSFPCIGGLDLVTPAAFVKPGRLINALNYEPVVTGGYRRILGYERFDGRPKPSEAQYWYVYFDAGTTAVLVGDIVTGLISTVTGEVLSVVLESGSYGGNDAAGYIVVFNATGLYQDNEALQVSAATVSTANGASELTPAPDEATDEIHLRATREATRADILAVPGSGKIRGVWSFGAKKYAFRDDAGATACVMFESTATGWNALDLGAEVSFTVGTAEFLDGETLTDGTATGVIVGVVITSGDWSTNDAVGWVHIKAVVGNFTATTITSASGSATGDGAQTANALAPGGLYEFDNHNFKGAAASKKMYGANGVTRAFQFDGSGFAFIHSGMVIDTPTHIQSHKKQLFLSFAGSVQHSAPGEPLVWNAILGAAELSTGEDVVGFDVQPGDVLGIWNRNSTYVLYGTGVSNWNLVTFDYDSGAIERTIQRLGKTMFIDDRGLSDLSTVQQFGDFHAKTISLSIDPLIQATIPLILSSVRIKSKDQYRVFATNKTGVIAMIGAKGKPSFTPFEFLHTVERVCAEENEIGVEEVFFGSDDGFVYQMEAGESFDGELIQYLLRFSFVHANGPRQTKRWRSAVFEIDAVLPPPLKFIAEFEYGSVDQPTGLSITIDPASISTGGAFYGTANWGEFVWDGQLVGQAEAHIDGSGINMSLAIQGESNYEPVHSVNGATYYYSKRGLKT